MSAETTPTGVPIIDCEQCGRRHPATRQHCPTCGMTHLVPYGCNPKETDR